MGCAGARPRLRSELERLFLRTASRGSAMAGAARGRRGAVTATAGHAQWQRRRHLPGAAQPPWRERRPPPTTLRGKRIGADQGQSPAPGREGRAAIGQRAAGGSDARQEAAARRAGVMAARAVAARRPWQRLVPGASLPLSLCPERPRGRSRVRGVAPPLTLSLSPLQRRSGRGRAACSMRGNLRGSLRARTR